MVLVPNPLTKVCTSYNQTIKCMRVHLAGQNLAVQQSLTQTHTHSNVHVRVHVHTRTHTYTHTHAQHMGTYSNTNKSGKVHK